MASACRTNGYIRILHVWSEERKVVGMRERCKKHATRYHNKLSELRIDGRTTQSVVSACMLLLCGLMWIIVQLSVPKAAKLAIRCGNLVALRGVSRDAMISITDKQRICIDEDITSSNDNS